MAKLDLSKLKKVQEELNNRSKGGDYLKQSELGEETDFRILPPTDEMGGIYFFEEIGYWIKGKRYVSPETFGEDCPIQEEIEEAKRLNDSDIKELLKNWQLFKKSSVFLVPGLLLECKFDKNNECTGYRVVDEKAKILQAGPELIKKINKIVTGRNFQNGTEDGICDREKGFNIILSKSGKGKDTEYDAQGWREPLEIDEKYYSEIPDVIALTREKMVSEKEMRAAIRSFLYGEEEKVERPKLSEKTTKRTNVPIDNEDDEEQEETRSRTSKSKVIVTSKADVKPARKAKLLDKLDEEDEE